MDPSRLLALVAVGGICSLAAGATLSGLLGWPPTEPGAIPNAALVAVAGLLLVGLLAAVRWGRTGADYTPYWG